MKKIITLLLIITLSIFFVHHDSQAIEDPVSFNLFEVNNQKSFGWGWNTPSATLSMGSPILIDWDTSSFVVNTMMTVGGVNKQVFAISNNKYTSAVRVTDKNSDAITIAIFYFQYIGSGTNQMKLVDGSGNNANLAAYKTHNIWITIALNQGVTFTESSQISQIANQNKTTYFNFIVTYFPIVIDPGDPGNPGNPSSQLDLLPLTAGSIFSSKMEMGRVTWNITGYTARFTIQYNGIYYLDYIFDVGTDMSIFNDAYEAFYYTHLGQKYIVFNHGTQSMFSSGNWKVQTFIPYTTWNLQTNELASINDFNVYLYAKEEAGNNMYMYFYADEFVIDRLISATLSFEYRYVPIIGQKGPWQPYFKVLEDTTINPGNISWQLQAAAVSSAATLIGAMIPGIGLPLLIIGTPLSFYFQYLSYQQLLDGEMLWTGSIQEIQKVIPSQTLKNEVDAAYRLVYPTFNSMDLSTYSLWKMHVGTFNKFFQKGIEVNPDSDMTIVQFRYMTNGQVYTVDEENINVIFSPGDMSPKEPDIIIPGFPDLLSSLGVWAYVIGGIGGIILIAYVVSFLDKASKSIDSLTRNPKRFIKLLIVLGLIVLVILALI